MTFAELHSTVKQNVFPDGLPSNLRNQFRNAVTDALIAAQKWCKTADGQEAYYQQRHINRVPFCATYFNCGSTVIAAPNGQVLDVYTIVDGMECCRVDYLPSINWQSYNQYVAEWTESWDEPANEGKPALPPGFKYAEATTDKTYGRAGFGHYFIHNRKLFVGPRLQSDEILVVEWSGLKQSYEDANLVVDDDVVDRELVRFVEAFTAHEIWSRFFQDSQQTQIFYGQMRNALADLISSAQDKMLANYDREVQYPSPRSVGLCGCKSKECQEPVADEDFGGVAATGDERVIGFTSDIQPEDETNLTDELAVESLMTSWNPDSLIICGDLREGTYTYPELFAAMTGYAGFLDRNAVANNRLWPVLGNHDWTDGGELLEWNEYFKMLPNNRRYYEFVIGAVHFFALSSYAEEPDGVEEDGPQAEWLRIKLAASKAKWKVVLTHYPPYSSRIGYVDGVIRRWPFKAWGADLVMSGHTHLYERLNVGGMPYLICGLGGEEPVAFGPAIAGSLFRYNTTFGAVRMVVGCDRLVCEFYPVGTTTPIDTLTLTKA